MIPDKEHRIQGALGAHASWARTADRAARTQAARDARWQQFLDEVDPDHVLDDDERHQRAGHARRAHLLRISLAAAKARRARAAAARRERDADITVRADR